MLYVQDKWWTKVGGCVKKPENERDPYAKVSVLDVGELIHLTPSPIKNSSNSAAASAHSTSAKNELGAAELKQTIREVV